MALGDLWIGTVERFTSVKSPAAITSGRSFYSEQNRFDNSGVSVSRSAPFARSYELVFPWADSTDDDVSVEVFTDLLAGEHGDGLIYMPDPMYYTWNLFAPAWASPGLIDAGWKNFGPTDPTFAGVTSSYDQPTQSATWNIDTEALTVPVESAQSIVIPIPPEYTLHVGVSGSVTGDGAVLWHDSAFDAGELTLLDPTAATRMNLTVDGADSSYARFWIGRTDATTSTVTIASMIAQLWPTGVTPVLTGNHKRGRGHTGLDFDGDSLVDPYTDASTGRMYKSLSVSLVEVGAWRP